MPKPGHSKRGKSGSRGGYRGRGRGRGSKRGRASGRPSRGDWTALDYVPLNSQFLDSAPSPANKSKKSRKLTGKRVLHEQRTPLRFQPVEFVRAIDGYDPAEITAKMIREPVDGEQDPEVEQLEREERENEEAMASDFDDGYKLTPQALQTETETGYAPEATSDDGSDVVWGLSETQPGEEEHAIEELRLDSMNLGSDTMSTLSEDNQEAAADMSNNDEVDSNVEEFEWNSESSGMVIESDPEVEAEDQTESDEESDFDEIDIEALKRFAARDFDGSYDDYFDEQDMMESDEADDMIQQLIEGSVDFDHYEAPAAPRREVTPVSARRKGRRQARELERLTNFGNDPVLWKKYPVRITVRDVFEELQAFVALEDMQELRFPPLDHNANWYVKELAKLFGTATFMQGRKHLKCVVVARTAHTALVRDYAKLRSLLSRRQTFQRVDLDVEKRTKLTKLKTNGARVRDGEVVGRHAEAIPSDNIGHRLMKMMGWTEGTGLGAQRAGITAPISATVKLTKRGINDSQQ